MTLFFPQFGLNEAQVLFAHPLPEQGIVVEANRACSGLALRSLVDRSYDLPVERAFELGIRPDLADDLRDGILERYGDRLLAAMGTQDREISHDEGQEDEAHRGPGPLPKDGQVRRDPEISPFVIRAAIGLAGGRGHGQPGAQPAAEILHSAGANPGPAKSFTPLPSRAKSSL